VAIAYGGFNRRLLAGGMSGYAAKEQYLRSDEVIEMRRPALLFGLALAWCQAWLPVTAYSQPAENTPRLGWIGNFSPNLPIYQAFRQGLRELGYIEGKNIAIEARWAEGNFDRVPGFARELARLNVNVMLVGGDQGLKAAKEATITIPIVVTACDPLDSLVASIARPGGKATGLTCISSELAGKRLQILKELVPVLARTAVLYNPDDRNKASEYRQMQEAAHSLNVTLHAYEARSSAEIETAFAAMVQGRHQALVILSDALMIFHEKKLADLALKNAIPAIYGFREFAEKGGLVTYGASLREVYRRAAAYVDKILKGASPGDLPIEQPTRFELVINLKTAKALSLKVPPNLLAIADEVIE
jgi:putative ABC transport system substrate-binding protein